MNIKLADFGFGREFAGKKHSTFVAQSPEFLQLKPYHGLNIDVCSLGVIIYRMMMRELPCEGKNFEEVKKQTLSGNFLVLYVLFLECQNF